ncbi:MAG: hypothetical protein LBL78_00725 [Prevotellaceae bacterium]|jgi:hypothetical protein|nr:hypothetical protein [Prevotellaceae bacterium]
MKMKSVTMGVIAAALLSVSVPTKAQETVEASIGGDLVSSYIWRGTYCGGVSIQPAVGIAYQGFSLGAWGSVGFDNNDTKEFDFTLGYSAGGFSAAVTDYWFLPADAEAQVGYFKYGAGNTQHVFEGTLGYDFGVLALGWNTNFAGNDARKGDGKRAYSTYVNLSVPFSLGGLDWSAEVGMTPWEGAYANKLNVTNLTLVAAKEIQLSETFALPAFAQVTFNPYTQGTYFVFGVSL